MIEIVTAKRSKNGLHVKYRVDGEDHFTDFFYNSINFYQLEKLVGPIFVQRLFFHIVAFDVCKFVTKESNRIMWGPFFGYVGGSFIDMWERQTQLIANVRPQPYHPPASISTNGVAPLTIDGSDEPMFTVSGRARKAKDNQHHVQIKTSKKHSSSMMTLFLALPVAAAHGISTVELSKQSTGGYSTRTTDYIHQALTPDITAA